MSKEEFKKLKVGDVVRHVSSIYGCQVFVITKDFGDRKYAVASVEATNPPEWELDFKP